MSEETWPELAEPEDHVFQAPEGEPWGRCVICHLAESAHPWVEVPYQPTARRRPEV